VRYDGKVHLNGELRISYNRPTTVKYKNTVQEIMYMSRFVFYKTIFLPYIKDDNSLNILIIYNLVNIHGVTRRPENKNNSTCTYDNNCENDMVNK